VQQKSLLPPLLTAKPATMHHHLPGRTQRPRLGKPQAEPLVVLAIRGRQGHHRRHRQGRIQGKPQAEPLVVWLPVVPVAVVGRPAAMAAGHPHQPPVGR